MTVSLFGIIIDVAFEKGVVTMRDNPKPFEIFQHFKGKTYQILALAKDAGDGRDMVVYQALYGDYTVYVRELTEFMSPVDKMKYPEVSKEYRFERQNGTTAPTEAGWKKNAETEQKVKSETGQKEKREIEQAEKAEAEKQEKQAAEQAEGNSRGEFLDPAVEEFLDADSVYEKLNILAGLQHRITNDMLEIMAAASDIELNEGSIQEKYSELKNCLLMTERYECKRIR